jgi:hypothetical protein
MTPVQILDSEATEERAENARLVRGPLCPPLTSCTSLTAHTRARLAGERVQSLFVGAIAIGDLVKSTLGPKGMVCVPT